MQTRYVVLIDIDGTLITGPETGQTAGSVAIHRATEDLTGRWPQVPLTHFAGNRDPAIARLLLEDVGEKNPSPERVGQLIDRYLEHLRSEASRRPYRVLGDPAGAVASLHARGGLVGLGTGNIREGGAIKLESAGLAQLFEGMPGGFARDGETRAQLLRAGARELDPSGELRVIIIGDTVHDISAALAIGALAVGVPYRHHTREILVEAGAHLVVEQLDGQLGETIDSLLSAPISG